ncbi:MAG: hypothetical protein HQ591_02050 [candidate division Zixibacteria bacterium]|nr:hypothetical protein [Candidatus Tariuqbacter arcticus]
MTFASRRTGIFDSQEIHQILKDDKYKLIALDEVLPGDIILYFSDDGDIEHSGLVITAPTKSLFGFPMIVSKWGAGHEFIHSAVIHEYSKSNIRCYRVWDEDES